MQVEYFDRPGSLTLNAALQPPHEVSFMAMCEFTRNGVQTSLCSYFSSDVHDDVQKTPAEREAEKRDKAEKQR